MGNPVNKEEKTEMQKLIETIESYLAKAEERLQQIADFREGKLSAETKEKYAKDTEKSYRSWRKEVEAGVDRMANSSRKIESNCDIVLRYMDGLALTYRNADTRELQQKRAEFAETVTRLTAAPELPDLYQEVMQTADTNLAKFDQATAEAQQKLQKLIAEAVKELEALKKDQEEILKQQEALNNADFHGDRENAQKLLEEQQKNLTGRGQKLRDEFDADMGECIDRVNLANSELTASTRKNESIFDDTERRNAVIAKAQMKRNKNLSELKERFQKAKEYCDLAAMKFKEPQNRAELETVFSGISDTKAGITGFFRRKKNDTAFQNMKTAVTDYLRNGGEDKAKKAYAECRNYLAGWMEKYNKLKEGSKTENIRNQGVVRMLELMEKMPDFQSSLRVMDLNREVSVGVLKDRGDDWEIVKNQDDARRYKRMDFKSLENSLAQHAEKTEQGTRHVGNNGNSKSFTDLDKRIAEKKAKARAAREKAAAKAAKDAAKAAKAAKKAKAKSGKAK